jgi:anti-anti-sigma regulatory factor
VCWSFDDREDLLAAASIWALEGLELGQRVVYAADRTAGELRSDLRPALDVDGLVDKGALTLMNLFAGYPGGGPVVPATQLSFYRHVVDHAVTDGFDGVRVIGDGTPLVRNPAHVDAMVRWELVADQFMATAPMSAMCAFDRSELPTSTLAELCTVHPVRHDPYDRTPFTLHAFDDGWVLTGHLESFVRNQLDRLLRQVAASEGRRVLIDVTGVAFVSATAASVLHRFALRLDASDRRLELRDATSLFRKVWHALGFDDGPARFV